MPTKAKKRKKIGESGDGKKFRLLKNLREVSDYYGVPLPTVEKWRAQGKFEPNADARWDTRRLDKVFADWTPRSKAPASAAAAPDDLDSEKKREEILRIKTDREIKELKREAMRGRHLDADEARAGIEDAASLIRKRLLAFPASVAVHLYGLEPEAIEARLEKEVRALLLNLSEELQRPVDKLQAVAGLLPEGDAEAGAVG